MYTEFNSLGYESVKVLCNGKRKHFKIHAMDYLWDNLYTTINSLGLEVLVRVLLDALICYGCVKLRNLKMKGHEPIYG